MTDIRSRHVQYTDIKHIVRCLYCNTDWPCNAMREADRADKADAMYASQLQQTWAAEAALAECRAALGALLQAPGDIFVRERAAAALSPHKEATGAV